MTCFGALTSLQCWPAAVLCFDCNAEVFLDRLSIFVKDKGTQGAMSVNVLSTHKVYKCTTKVTKQLQQNKYNS